MADNKPMLEIPLSPIRRTGREVARAFADADASQQVDFLLAFADAVDGFWPMQCRYIVDQMNAEQRQRVVAQLEVLVDHLIG